VIGMDLALARLILSLAFGIGIGIIMAIIFNKEDAEHDRATDAMFAKQRSMRRPALVFLLILTALLVIGTFQIGVLKNVYLEFNLPIRGTEQFQNFLHALVPFDASRGEEGVSVQGAVLIGLLALIGFSSWKGLEKIHEGFNTWTWVSTSLVGITLAFAALNLQPAAEFLGVQLTGKFFGILLSLIVLGWMLKKALYEDEMRDFLWETWRFIKQIFPLLIAGVFLVGIIRGLIQPEWIETLAGQNTLFGNLVGVLFGVFMYFPTLVEVPIAQMFLSLGMHRGPLLAYLISDPELSLQSILITATIIGKLKAWVYVGWVALFSTAAGLLYGAWVDGTALLTIMLYLASMLVVIVLAFFFVNRFKPRNQRIAEKASHRDTVQ